MLKSLMLSILSVVGVGAPVVYTGGVTEVTYVAETNDVNSIDDLVEGNIYHFTYDTSLITSATTYLVGYSIHNINTINGSITSIYGNGTNRISVYKGGSNHTTHYIGYSGNNIAIAYTENGIFSCDIVYYSYASVIPIEAFSRCENIPVLSVEHRDNEGLFNILTEFINTNIFTGGVMDSVNFEVLGSTFTLGSYLSLITTIIILGLIIYLLIRLVYWVGCLFTKSFRGR